MSGARQVGSLPVKLAQPASCTAVPGPERLLDQVAGYRDIARWARFDGEICTKAGLRADLDRNQWVDHLPLNQARPGQRAGGGPTYPSRDSRASTSAGRQQALVATRATECSFWHAVAAMLTTYQNAHSGGYACGCHRLVDHNL